MKNQYVGYIEDFGKYGLLRAFAWEKIRVGINWYLMPDEGKSDDKYTDYLTKDQLCRYDPQLFDALHRRLQRGQRTVADIERSQIIPGALFFSEPLDFSGKPAERQQQREKWFA